MSAKSFRAECVSRALRCVEELLEKDITEQQILKTVEVLSADQYADVVEERNIEHLCGYPLCSTVIRSIPQQKYHVSKFCSEVCFKCSQYLAAQLSPLPLWSRTGSRVVKIKLLLPQKSPPAGDLPLLSTEQVTSPPVTQSSSDILKCCTSSFKHSPFTHSLTPSLLSELPKVDSVKEKSYLKPTDESASPSTDHDPSSSTSNLGMDLCKMSLNITQLPKVSQVSKLLSAFSTWVSIPPSGGALFFQSCDESQKSSDRRAGNNKLDENTCNDGQNEAERTESPGAARDVVVFLPPVDSVNVRQVQYKLFVNQMKKYLSGVCSKLGLQFHSIMPRVTLTVAKFRFDRHCITFRPAEWRVIIVLLIIISCGDGIDISDNTLVSQWLEDIKATREDFKLMLESFSTTD